MSRLAPPSRGSSRAKISLHTNHLFVGSTPLATRGEARFELFPQANGCVNSRRRWGLPVRPLAGRNSDSGARPRADGSATTNV